jgi:hypothetical protein
VPLEPFSRDRQRSSSGWIHRGVVFAVPGEPTDPEPYYTPDIPVDTESTATTVGGFHGYTYDAAHHRWLLAVAANFDPNEVLANVTVRDYHGPWTTVGTFVQEKAKSELTPVRPTKFVARIAVRSGSLTTIVNVTRPEKRGRFLLRAVAWDVRGRIIQPNPSRVTTFDVMIPSPRTEIGKLEIQSCPVSSIFFRNVSLRPL